MDYFIHYCGKICFDYIVQSFFLRRVMIYSMDKELNALWLEVEILTGTKYLKIKISPNISDEFSYETNHAIRNLKDLDQRINNCRDVRLLTLMQ